MQMKRLALVLLLASGCKKEDPLFCQMNPGKDGCPGEDIDADVTDDADVIGEDVMPDVPDRLAYGSGAYSFTLATTAQDALLYTANTDFNTSSTACRPAPADWLAAGQPDACFLVGTVIRIPASITLNVTGTRPLVLVSGSNIEIAGTLDIAGHVSPMTNIAGPPSKAGPGADGTYCMGGTSGGASVDGGGGGGGGGFMGTGGADGGDGGVGNNNGTATMNVTMAPTRLRAGCSGTDGGTGHGTVAGGKGGGGGGGVYLIAAGEIKLSDGAIINASGGGGGLPGREAGGGGGGSGGMIVLAAPMISAMGTAFIVANGGSGGAGADDSGGGLGTRGNDPDPTMPTVPAPGPTGSGGDGGAGGAQGANTVNGTNGQPNEGGGGGGGSIGYIQANRAITGVSVSPMITVVPDL